MFSLSPRTNLCTTLHLNPRVSARSSGSPVSRRPSTSMRMCVLHTGVTAIARDGCRTQPTATGGGVHRRVSSGLTPSRTSGRRSDRSMYAVVPICAIRSACCSLVRVAKISREASLQASPEFSRLLSAGPRRAAWVGSSRVWGKAWSAPW